MAEIGERGYFWTTEKVGSNSLSVFDFAKRMHLNEKEVLIFSIDLECEDHFRHRISALITLRRNYPKIAKEMFLQEKEELLLSQTQRS